VCRQAQPDRSIGRLTHRKFADPGYGTPSFLRAVELHGDAAGAQVEPAGTGLSPFIIVRMRFTAAEGSAGVTRVALWGSRPWSRASRLRLVVVIVGVIVVVIVIVVTRYEPDTWWTKQTGPDHDHDHDHDHDYDYETTTKRLRGPGRV